MLHIWDSLSLLISFSFPLLLLLFAVASNKQ